MVNCDAFLTMLIYRKTEVKMSIIEVKTQTKEELIDITARVQEEISSSGIKEGFCLVYVPHTTAGVTINENADPSVREDLLMTLEKIVPESLPFKHLEGNSPAHVKASLVGSSVNLIVKEGRLSLGTWQGVFFCEFDGPRRRKVSIKTFSF
jgi:secondary thiamine-phosphate synthase enzyme